MTFGFILSYVKDPVKKKIKGSTQLYTTKSTNSILLDIAQQGLGKFI